MTDPTPTNLSPSPAPSPSPSPSPAPNGGSSPTPSAATRPDYVPEAFWDPATNAVKTAEFTTHIGELAALKAAHDARVAARPEKPDGYELKFADTFKPDVAIKFDETDPRLAPLRAFAHENNLDQAGFSKLLEIEAGRVIAENKTYAAAVEAETKKLGANATARVTALKTWLTGALGADAANDLLGKDNTGGLLVFSEAAVRHLEKLQLAMSNQGGSNYSGNGREPPPPPAVPLEKKLWPKRQNVA